MRIKRLTLVNFRSYRRLDLSLEQGLNFFTGPNGAGKTNILEAIYMLGTTRSPRSPRDRDLVMWGQDSYYLAAEVARAGSVVRVELFYRHDQGKGARINGVPQKRVSDVLGHLNVVFFSPDDLSLLKGGPSGRRSFLDDQICQVSPVHFRHLARYSRILQQRNGVLRDARSPSGVMGAFDDQLAEAGARILAARLRAVADLAPVASAWVDTLSAGADTLTVRYSPSLDLPPDPDPEQIGSSLLSALQRSRPEEVRRGHTLTGPHRDDLELTINNVDARAYASQGQQRTVALALKLQQMDFIQRQRDEVPILLLDDVLSELDEGRRRVIIDRLPLKAQTLVTSTDPEALAGAQAFAVGAGTVTRVKGG